MINPIEKYGYAGCVLVPLIILSAIRNDAFAAIALLVLFVTFIVDFHMVRR